MSLHTHIFEFEHTSFYKGKWIKYLWFWKQRNYLAILNFIWSPPGRVICTRAPRGRSIEKSSSVSFRGSNLMLSPQYFFSRKYRNNNKNPLCGYCAARIFSKNSKQREYFEQTWHNWLKFTKILGGQHGYCAHSEHARLLLALCCSFSR